MNLIKKSEKIVVILFDTRSDAPYEIDDSVDQCFFFCMFFPLILKNRKVPKVRRVAQSFPITTFG